jgi:WD40 repeat protein
MPTISPAETETATPTATATIPPEARLKYQCIEVRPVSPGETASEGIVVLDSRVVVGSRYKPETFLLDLATGKSTQIAAEGERQSEFAVSPGRKLMAYSRVVLDASEKVVKDELVIASADGQQQKAIPWEEGWSHIVGWLDDQRVVINLFKRQENLVQMYATFLVLDPFTGKRQMLRPDFPAVYDVPRIPDWYGWSITAYDPTLTRVVYPMFTGNGYEHTYVIWDLKRNRILARLDAVFKMASDYLPAPRWSPDGSRLVVEGSLTTPPAFETFLVSRDGQIEQLTNLYAYEKARLSGYSWSPDGRYIATWLNTSSLRETREAELVVVDTLTKQITDYCIRVKYGGEEYGDELLAPIWSPGGKQLIVQDWYEKDHRRVILVNPGHSFAVPIVEDMEPAGWMLEP